MSLEARLLDFRQQESREYNALSRVLLESVSKGSSPILSFNEIAPTVSIGKSQSLKLDVDQESCLKQEVNIVRRDSGGQSVYVDDGYLVFYLVGSPALFSEGLKNLRKDFSTAMVDTLREFNVPAEFHEPDNVVIRQGDKIKTIGNSGQVIARDAILIQGSIRYQLNNFDRMLDVLKVNGHKLHPYRSEISNILGEVVSYTTAPQEQIRIRLMQNLATKYGLNLKPSELNPGELERLDQLSSDQHVSEKLSDKEWFKARGVCYFFVGGTNLVTSLRTVLPYNKPSTALDSTLTLESPEVNLTCPS